MQPFEYFSFYIVVIRPMLLLGRSLLYIQKSVTRSLFQFDLQLKKATIKHR